MLFKCKICGGKLNVNKGERITECEYCGIKQTVPGFIESKTQEIYNCANTYLMNNEFDKAENLYNQILFENKEDADAYWNVLMCRYGVSYVKDPASGKYIPTCNRTMYASIFNDENYQNAMKYADKQQKELYTQNAKKIDNIQKGILEVSKKEKPFDVFICYKETDEQGRRTHDSVLANDLYHHLTQEGFKVFYSRITLEDKLGLEYEPYIFAALNSAKVMVVIGTRPEYFEAAWVKNEWLRFLELIKKGENKILIPAYSGMSPYDLPEEFSNIQSQDMSKIGFMNDLIRGIKKIINPNDLNYNYMPIENASVDSLLKRAFIFLSDGEFKSANKMCEQILNIDPENANAYLAKLMAELKVKNKESLATCDVSFANNSNYKKITNYADSELKTELERYLQKVDEKILRKSEKNKKMLIKAGVIFSSCFIILSASLFVFLKWVLPSIKYNDAVEMLNKNQYEKCIPIFEKLGDYRDSQQFLGDFVIVPTKKTIKSSDGDISTISYIYDEIGRRTKVVEKDKYGDKTTTEYIYDENGNMIRYACSSIYSSSSDDYEYDDDGNCIKRRTVTIEGDTYITEFSYDENGSCIKSVESPSNSDYFYISEYEYDIEGNLIKAKWTDNDKTEPYVAWSEYVYNSKGLLIKENSFDNGTKTTVKYEYDEDGNCITEKSEFTLREFAYDDQGNCIKVVHSDSGKVSYIKEYMYDKNGNCVKEVVNSYSTSSKYIVEYSYDDRNNLIREVVARSEEDKSSTEYQYDENGNCVMEIIMNNNGTKRTTEYNYEYDVIYVPRKETTIKERNIYEIEYDKRIYYIQKSRFDNDYNKHIEKRGYESLAEARSALDKYNEKGVRYKLYDTDDNIICTYKKKTSN